MQVKQRGYFLAVFLGLLFLSAPYLFQGSSGSLTFSDCIVDQSLNTQANFAVISVDLNKYLQDKCSIPSYITEEYNSVYIEDITNITDYVNDTICENINYTSNAQIHLTDFEIPLIFGRHCLDMFIEARYLKPVYDEQGAFYLIEEHFNYTLSGGTFWVEQPPNNSEARVDLMTFIYTSLLGMGVIAIVFKDARRTRG